LRSNSYIILLWAFCLVAPLLLAQAGPEFVESLTVNKTVNIPRVSRPPTIEDFLSMKAAAEFADGKMAKIDKLYQRNPSDGQPVSERTEVYLGYDAKNLYAVFVCFDSDPKAIRARLSRREDGGFADENAEIMLDTFNDQRHAYGFMSNPLGIQADGIYTEPTGWDMSFDTLWYSKGKLTEEGYVVWMAIPFKSLRFPPNAKQTWGVILDRDIPRKNEDSYWPHYTSSIAGRMNQAGQLTGLENISPGRNMQFIPYGSFRSYRAPDFRDTTPRFAGKAFKGDMGLDSKIVIKDGFVLDTTVNPDFSQVESDQPQVTTNQRFEVFFPEKRPFFIENASFFRTPINLVFTRRIADPDFGIRLTGKKGPYAVGALFSDDRSPGRTRPDNDPLTDSRARFAIVRVNREFGNQSGIGVIYTDREYQGSFNRVGGIDTNLKLNKNWVFDAQAIVSSTRFTDGTYRAGPSFLAELQRTGRHFTYAGNFQDTSGGFITETGFFQRPDYRTTSHVFTYTFRPEGKYIVSHGVRTSTSGSFDHGGFSLDSWHQARYFLNFRRQTNIEIGTGTGTEGLRPTDFASLHENKRYSEHEYFLFMNSNYFKRVGIAANLSQSHSINFNGIGINDPGPAGNIPGLGLERRADLTLTVRPTTPWRIDNTYIYRRLEDPPLGVSAYNLHILRSKWSYQVTKELSLRFIGQYNAQLTNPLVTTLQTEKQFNADFLVSYLLHPGTAFYVGYNSNLQNLTPNLGLDPSGTLTRTRNTFINDGRQFFVKISYLFRY
jgi:hypothetical protein